MIAPLLLLTSTLALTSAPADQPLTVAESSGFQATAHYDDVIDFLGKLEAASPLVRRASMGRTVEGRSMPLLIVADPPVATATEAHADDRLVFFVFADIHAGEVCGKEASLMLARDLALQPDKPANRAMLDAMIFVIAPIYNADGNERFAKDNRPGQIGPAQGMGQRTNAMGLDLNRDWMKLESPEAQAMVHFLTEWNPHITIDTHTTNGSQHRYTLCYAAPQNPSGHQAPITFVRDVMLPEVSRELEARTGYKTFFYGNFNREHTVWATYSSQPRFGCPYRGLRGRMSILSEAYAYASYEDRVRATLAFVRQCALFAANRRTDIIETLDRARRETIEAGLRPTGDDMVGVRHRIAAFDAPVTLLGYTFNKNNKDNEFDETNGHRRAARSSEPRDYLVRHFGRFEPTLEVPRPFAYLIPPDLTSIVDKLRQHGVKVETLIAPAEFEAGVDHIDSVQQADKPFQGHRLLTVNVTKRTQRRRFKPGWFVVRTAQPLGTLALYLLEPEADDGLTAWGFFGDRITPGADAPILRAIRAVPLKTDASK